MTVELGIYLLPYFAMHPTIKNYLSTIFSYRFYSMSKFHLHSVRNKRMIPEFQTKKSKIVAMSFQHILPFGISCMCTFYAQYFVCLLFDSLFHCILHLSQAKRAITAMFSISN